MNPKKTIRPEHKKQHAKNTIRSIKRHWQLYLIVALPLVYLIVFKYMPIIGSQIAFRDYNFKGGIWHSPFVGLKYFKMFFQSPQFWRLMGNTLGLSVWYCIGSFSTDHSCDCIELCQSAMVRKDGTDGNVYALFYFYRFDRRYSVTDVISDGSGESPDRESGRTGHSFYGRA